MTHPFHPWFNQEFDLVCHRQSWREDRVYLTDEGGDVRSLPASWTDAAPPDPFVVVAAGRSPFRPADLVALAELVDRLRSSATKRRVRRITP